MGIEADISVVSRLVKVFEPVWRWMHGRRTRSSHAADAKRILGIASQTDVAYRHASVHSLYREGPPHPDNFDALLTAAGRETREAAAARRLETVSRLEVPEEQSMVLLGSPTAEGLSRVVFGYRASGEEDSLVLDQPPLDLPFRWELDASEIAAGSVASRFVRGRGIVGRPNWRIVRTESGGTRPFIPAVDAEGMLETDYLLVTRMRNFLTQKALDEGKYIVSFGGTHGTATRAIELLFSDERLLAEVAPVLAGSPEAYQLLFRVSGMRHDPKRGTRANHMELVAAEPLDDYLDRWRSANQIVQRAFARWLRNQTA